MTTNTNIRIYSPILQEAHQNIDSKDRTAFELSFRISERIYKVLKERGLSKRDLAHLTGKKESEVSRWFSFGHNFTCKTISLISQALNTDIVKVVQ